MDDRTIRVIGHGHARRVPDIAEVQLGIQVTRPTASTARDDGAALMDRVVAAITALGIAPAELRTAGLSLGPTWEYPADRSPRLAGYQLSNRLAVTVREAARVAAVIDAAIAAGATTLDGVVFRVADEAAAAREALASAVADARARAETLAAAAGLRVTSVISIAEGEPSPEPPTPLLASAEVGLDTPVLGGTSGIAAAVVVMFAVADASGI